MIVPTTLPLLNACRQRTKATWQIRLHTETRVAYVHGDRAVDAARTHLDDILCSSLSALLPGTDQPAFAEAFAGIFPSSAAVRMLLNTPYAYFGLRAWFASASLQASLRLGDVWNGLTEIRQSTAHAICSPAMQLLLRMTESGAYHPYIEEGDRTACAALLESLISAGITPECDGWYSALELLGDTVGHPGPVVLSTSGGEFFPNLGMSMFELDPTDADGAAWCSLTERERWDYSMLALYEYPGLRIHPDAPARDCQCAIFDYVKRLRSTAARLGIVLNP